MLSAGPGLTQEPRPALSPVAPEVQASTIPVGPPTTAHLLDPRDLGPFLDGVLGLQLARDDIAGAVVVIVKDGRPVFEKGYGYSDVANKTPVDPMLTEFRIASISKTFTGTAVMQLVEQGKLDLDRDVSTYLDFPLKRRFESSITLRRLLTHTAGFEERGKNFLLPRVAPLPDLRDYLIRNAAPQAYPPGSRIAYSNYGVSLAGYIVQRVTGRSWQDQIQTTIFQPLGMQHSSAAQPLPPSLAATLSKEYDRASQPAIPFQPIPDAPAGAITTTGDDMARYLIAHLADGDTLMLKAATLAEMHRLQWSAKPGIAGISINFYEVDGHGHRVLGHAGDLSRFHSELWLVPDQKLGVFIAYNTTGAGSVRVRDEFWSTFLDRYLPVTQPMPAAIATAQADAQAVAGHYLATRRAQTSLLEPFYLIGQFSVAANADSTISLGQLAGPNGVPLRWREVAPLIFREEGGSRQIGFVRDASGRVELFAGGATLEGERPTFWQDLLVLGVLYGAAALVLLIAIVQWPLGAWARRHYRRPLAEVLDKSARRERLALKVVALLALLFFAAWNGFFCRGCIELSAAR